MFVAEADFLIPGDPAARLLVTAHIPKAQTPGIVGRCYPAFQILLIPEPGGIDILRCTEPVTHEQAALTAASLLAAGRGTRRLNPSLAGRLRFWVLSHAGALPRDAATLEPPENPGNPYLLPVR